MNINELDAYNLADAVRFNQELNPAIWNGNTMKPEVRKQLLAIAEDFREFLGLSNINVKDITVSGSNAAYTYTPHSDIDLHLVVDIPQADSDEVYRELFDAKKYQYNDLHNYKIHGYDVELYVENANKPPVSQGIYSIKDNDWVRIPRKIRAQVNDEAVKSKFEDIGHRIESAVSSKDFETLDRLAKKIKNFRQAGLDQSGEFGPENLAYKMLRTQGLIKKLYDARNAAKDSELSLTERRKKKKKRQVKYGLGGYWYPGFGFAGSGETSDGGGDGGGESRYQEDLDTDGIMSTKQSNMSSESVGDREELVKTDEEILRDFVDFVVKELKIESLPQVKLRKDPQWPVVHKTFGRYIDDKNLLEVAWGQRHIMDVLRTVAHELTHRRQHEREEVPADAGETGSRWENEANARAGILMRDYARLHPEYFAHGQADDLTGLEEDWKKTAGAMAAAACIAGTPGCATTTGQAVKDIQTVGRTAQTVKNMSKAGVQDELNQELRNFIRAQGQGPGSASAKNQSRLYQLQKKMQKPEDVKEGASGYIPTKKQSKDPRFSMALTQDIQPGQVGKEANKLGLETDSQGHPKLVAKVANALREFKETGRVDSLGNQAPTGSESKPTMPAGTLRVDVSDVYDWYKLGQHISNMKGLGQHDFGQGPPSSIISFGDEDTEHKFIKDIQATGLDVTDIDPADPAHPDVKIKTDPTYNVTEELLDLTKMYQGYQSVIGQVLDTSSKKTKIKIVAADGTGKLKVGDVISVSPHYLKNVPVAEACWDGYRQQGMKKKGDRMVPNCVKVAEEEQLDEVSMKPSRLKQFADSKEAEGILAGFEAEMIFRDAQGDEDFELEPDYDADERAYSISQVIDFFQNDDYGYGLTERQASRLQGQLDESYFEWYDSQMYDAFRDEQDDLIREVLLEERPMTERIHDALTEGQDFSDDEADRIIKAGEKAPRFTRLDDQEIYAEENPDYEAYLKAAEDADAILDEEVETSVSNQDGYYDAALEKFRENFQPDDSDFFTDVGLRWMSDIANEYNLEWPVMTGGGQNDGGRSWQDIAYSLSQATGMEVNVGGGYHSLKRGNYYVLEPDGSLDPDDKSSEVGLEIVSPPMPLNQAIEQLNKVLEWAETEGDAYTNRSTGLHMGVSIPYKGGDVDYVKLALFMGDEHVLKEFGRSANHFCASAVEKLRQNVAGSKNRNDDKIASAMELMKNNLIELAQKYVQQGVGQAKYTSVHIKPGYIEFRSPGGDYLSKADRDIGSLENTMRRFAYAMYLAGRPDLERKEYYKKLYKLIAPEGNRDLELFSKFSAGEITAEELKKQWAEKTLAKEVPGGVKTKSNWRLYDRSTNKPVEGMEFSGYTEIDALERAKAKVSPDSSMAEFKQAYELRDVGTNTGRWRVIRRDSGETLEIIDAETRGEANDQAYDKYTDVIPYYIEPYGGGEPEPKLSRRAKLAKQIARPTDYVIINKHSGLPFYTFGASSLTSAVDLAVNYLRGRGLDVENFTVQRASNVKQSVDNAVDSKQLQQRVQGGRYQIVDRRTDAVVGTYLASSEDDAHNKYNNWLRNQGIPVDTENYGYRAVSPVQDVGIDVAQNFSDPGQAQRAQNIRDAAPRSNFEFYVHDQPNQVFHRMNNATADEVRAYIERQEQEGMPMGLLRVRQVSESTNGAEDAQRALDAAARKLGYASFAQVRPGDRNTVMQMAAHALKSGVGHYDMLKKKQTK